MNETEPKKKLESFLSVVGLALILGVGSCAFILSYHGQQALGVAMGFPDASLIPCVVDLTLMALAITAYRAKLLGTKPIRAQIYLGIATLVSILFNIYLAPDNFNGHENAFLPRHISPVYIAILLHSIGPVSLFLLTELALSLIGPRQNAVETKPQNDSQKRDISIQSLEMPPKSESLRQKPDPTNATAARSKKQTNRRKRIAKMKQTNKSITPAEISKTEGVTLRTAQRDLQSLQS